MADETMPETTASAAVKVGVSARTTSTTLTTPLLSSYSDTDDSYARPSNGVTTVRTSSTTGPPAMTMATLGAQPYLRYRLASRFIPPNHNNNALPPHLLEQANISPEEWLNFWTQIKPLVLELERIEKYGSLAAPLFWLLWFWILCTTDYRYIFGWEQSISFLSFSLPPCMFPFLQFLYKQYRQSKLSNISTFCQEADAATVFHTNGFSLECELVPSEVNGSRMHLFILPVDKPYTRFEVYNGRPGCWSTYETSLGSGDVRPDCLDFLPLEEWSEFWSAMKNRSGAHRRSLSVSSRLSGALVGLWFLVFIVENMEATEVLVAIALVGSVGLFVFLAVYFVYHFYVFLAAKVNLVFNYAIQSAPCGVYMEHRRLLCFHPWLGLYERHYVYMFRLTGTPNPNHLDEAADDVGSIHGGESVGARERHSII